MDSQQTGVIDIYARQSRVGAADQSTIPDQISSCRVALRDRGLNEGEVFSDGKSGWNPKTHRAGWEAMMARLESGASAGVIVFDIERFSRQPDDGSRLIRLAKRGLRVYDSDQAFDLTTASGIKAFRDALAAAEYYSNRLRDRIRRTKDRHAREGRTSGTPRPFGCTDGTRMEICESEARWIRYAAREVRQGRILNAVLREINGRDDFHADCPGRDASVIAKTLHNPRTAGLYQLQRHILPVQAQWPAIIPEKEWLATKRILDSRKRPGTGPKGDPWNMPGRQPTHIGTGIFLCGQCLDKGRQSFLRGNHNNYFCYQEDHARGTRGRRPALGRFQVRKAFVDHCVNAAIIEKLRRPDAARLTAETEDTTLNMRLKELREEEDRVVGLLDEYDELRQNGDISKERFMKNTADLEGKLTGLRRQIVQCEVEKSDPLAGLAGNPDVGSMWPDLSIERQSAVISRLCDVIIDRPAANSNRWYVWDPEFITFEWKDEWG